jgi:AcrR family transcriptional regulator
MPRARLPWGVHLATHDLLGHDGAMRRGPKQHAREHVDAVQRQRLLEATVEAVAEVGYAGLTVALVIERARVSRKTFYELFKDCEECFLATFQWGVAQLSSLALEAYHEESCWRDGVRACLATVLGFLDIERDWARLLVIESLAAGGLTVAARVELLEQLTLELERGAPQSDGEGSLPLASQAIIGGSMWVIYTNLLESPSQSLMDLHGPLMALTMLPYLDVSEARKELDEALA